jgi:hypothetical protein
MSATSFKTFLVNSTYTSSLEILQENIINSGDTSIELKNPKTGDKFDTVYSADTILSGFLSSYVLSNNRIPESVEKWYKSNFANWLKKGAPGYTNEFNMTEARLKTLLFEPLNDFISRVVDEEDDPSVTRAVVMGSLPSYIRQDDEKAYVFSGGRKFRLKRLSPSLHNLTDYLIAVQQEIDAGNTNGGEIVPRTLMANAIGSFTPVIAFKNEKLWHEYVRKNAEKVDAAEKQALVKTLEKDVDYKIIDELGDGFTATIALSKKCTDVEGKIMTHCVASYSGAVLSGKTTIVTIRDKTGMSGATIEVKDGVAHQIKGKHNGVIYEPYLSKLLAWFKKHKTKIGGQNDYKNIQMTSSEYGALIKPTPDTKTKKKPKAVAESYLYEANRKEAPKTSESKTKSKTKSTQNMDDLVNSRDAHPLEPVKKAKSGDVSREPDNAKPVKGVKVSSAKRSQEKLNKTSMSGGTLDRAINLLRNAELDHEDEISDEEALKQSGRTRTNHGVDTKDDNLPAKKTTTTALATISKEIATLTDVEMEWLKVSTLPGYLQQGIRTIGRQVFKAFTSTALEQILILANIGNGPSSKQELKAAATYAKQFGSKNKEAELVFDKGFPGYEATVSIWDTDQYTMMFVKDFAGDYVYMWPVKDNIVQAKMIDDNTGAKSSSDNHKRLNKMKLIDITENTSNIPAILKKLGIDVTKCTIHPDGTVDVKGNVDISKQELTEIPVQFGIVSGKFNCEYNKLTSLQGAPREVVGSFYCYGNKLESLQGAPREVGGHFVCFDNKFKSEPDHSHINIGGEFKWK